MLKVVIIGAGMTGIHMAIKCIERGINDEAMAKPQLDDLDLHKLAESV